MKHNLLTGGLSLLLAAGIIIAGMTLPNWLLQKRESTLYAGVTSVSQESISPYGSNFEALKERIQFLQDSDHFYDLPDRSPIQDEMTEEDICDQFLTCLWTVAEQANLVDVLGNPDTYTLEYSALYYMEDQPSTSLWLLEYISEQDIFFQVLLDPTTGTPLRLDLMLDPLSPYSAGDPQLLWQCILDNYSSLYDLTFTDMGESYSENTSLPEQASEETDVSWSIYNTTYDFIFTAVEENLGLRLNCHISYNSGFLFHLELSLFI